MYWQMCLVLHREGECHVPSEISSKEMIYSFAFLASSLALECEGGLLYRLVNGACLFCYAMRKESLSAIC